MNYLKKKKKPLSKDSILYDAIYTTFQKGKNVTAEHRSVVARAQKLGYCHK